jgi:hypothetical protein
VLTRNSAVSIESEDLKITLNAVTVRYVFRNQRENPVTLTVAFPLPDIDLSDDANVAFSADDPLNYVGFSTKIDGKPASFTVNQQAFLHGKDVTASLREMAIPLLPLGKQQLKVSELPQTVRDRAVAEGLLLQSGTNDKGLALYDPTWTLKTSVVRQQTFPPGKSVSVEHRFRTSVGMSFDSVLRQGLRPAKALAADVARYKSDFCINDDTLKSIDNLAGPDNATNQRLIERRISYVLKTGANWAGPIKSFRLTIDKGQADRVVSFCGTDVKTISPTAVEMRATDFTPTRDLNIIILGRK